MENQLEVGEGDHLLTELRKVKAMIVKERNDRAKIEQRYERLKASVENFASALKDFIEKLRGHLLETNAQPNPFMEMFLRKLDSLYESVQTTLLAHSRDQIILNAEVAEDDNQLEVDAQPGTDNDVPRTSSN